MPAAQSPQTLGAAAGGLSNGLECLVGRVQFAIPVETVDQVIEYDVSPPPPLASPWVGGLGIHAGRVLLSVSLVSKRAATVAARRTTKGVLLTAPDTKIAWAFEVGGVAAFVKAKVLSKGVQVGQAKLPSWVTAATTSDGRSIGWVHASAMIKDLAGVLESAGG